MSIYNDEKVLPLANRANPRGRVYRWIVTCILPPIIIGFLLVTGLWLILRDLPLGMMGGDCPEASSYGSATIRGVIQDVTNSPVKNVAINVRKEQGICPQSVHENINLVSDIQGRFEGLIAVHLGDPPLHIRVEAEDYPPYEFEVSVAQTQFAIVELEVQVVESIQVQWRLLSPELLTLEAQLTSIATAEIGK